MDIHTNAAIKQASEAVAQSIRAFRNEFKTLAQEPDGELLQIRRHQENLTTFVGQSADFLNEINQKLDKIIKLLSEM